MNHTPPRIGIIGCGGITAFAHVPALCAAPACGTVVALYDSNEARARHIKKRFSLSHADVKANYREMLDDDSVAAVIIATPPKSRPSIAVEAIEAEKHVLLQKPLALTQEYANKILCAGKKTRKQILALPMPETIPSLVELKDTIRTQDFGTIRFARIRTTIPGPEDYYEDVRWFFGESPTSTPPYLEPEYAEKAGSLADMGVYALTAFYFLFGPGTVLGAQLSGLEYESTALVTLEIPANESNNVTSPALCSLEIAWREVQGHELCTIFGSDRTAYLDTSGQVRLIEPGRCEPLGTFSTCPKPLLPTPPIAAQERWLEAVSNGYDAAFRDSLEAAAWVSGALEEIYKQARAAKCLTPQVTTGI